MTIATSISVTKENEKRRKKGGKTFIFTHKLGVLFYPRINKKKWNEVESDAKKRGKKKEKSLNKDEWSMKCWVDYRVMLRHKTNK